MNSSCGPLAGRKILPLSAKPSVTPPDPCKWGSPVDKTLQMEAASDTTLLRATSGLLSESVPMRTASQLSTTKLLRSGKAKVLP